MAKKAGLLLLIAWTLVIVAFPSQAASRQDTFYIAPLYLARWGEDYNIDYQNLMEMKSRLGAGGEYVKIGFTTATGYMNETWGRQSDFIFNPTFLRRALQLSVDTNLPVVIILNGGPWGDPVPENPEVNLIDYLELDVNNSQWKDDNTVPPDDGYPYKNLGRLLTLNNYNSTIRTYKERNFKAAAREVYAFSQQHPDLFIGVTIDAEVFMNPYYFTDYNPQTIQEFRDYERRKFGGDISLFNRAMGTNFRSFNEIDPPRPSLGQAIGGNPLGEEWTDFKISLVDNNVQLQVNWAREVGFPADKIYTHQSVRYDNPDFARYMLSSPISTAVVEGGSLGLTTLQDLALDRKLFSDARALSPNWGIFEYNPTKPTGTDYNTYIRALELVYDYGAQIISPYTWIKEPIQPLYNIKNTVFEIALRDFIAQKSYNPTPPGTAMPASSTLSSGGMSSMAGSLQPLFGEITGRVLNTLGQPIPGTAVRAGNIVVPTEPTTGEFRIPKVPPDVYTVYYDAPGYISQTQEGILVFAGQTTTTPTVIISKPATTGIAKATGEIFGRVVNQAGQTIPGTVIRINNVIMPTNPGGEFRFTLVHPGIYTIYYDAPGHIGQTQVIQVNAGAAARPPTVIMSRSSKKKDSSLIRRSRKRLSQRRTSRALRARRR